jgi:hypothetical protein
MILFGENCARFGSSIGVQTRVLHQHAQTLSLLRHRADQAAAT